MAGSRGGNAAWQLSRPTGTQGLLMAVAVVGVSLSAPLTALVVAPVLGIAFWRNAVGAVLLAPSAGTRYRAEFRSLRGRQLARSALAGAFLAGHFAAWLPSITLTTVAASTALVTTTPIWTALVARLAGHPVPGQVWVGLGLAAGGVALVTGVDVTVSGAALLGDGLALLGGALAAGYVLLGSLVRSEVSTTPYAVVCYSTCAALIAAVAALTGTPLIGYDLHDWLLIGAIALSAQMLGHTILNQVVSSVGPTVVGLVILLEVPGAALLAAVLLGQVPSLLVLPGLALLVAGVALVIRSGAAQVEAGPVN